MPVSNEEILAEVQGARGQISGVGTSVSGLGTTLGGLGTDLGGIEETVDGISGFLGIGGGGPQDLFGAIQGSIGDGDFLKELLEQAAKLIGEIADVLVDGFGNAFLAGDLQEKLWNTIGDLVGKLIDFLLEAIDGIKNAPDALGRGPLDALESVRDLGRFLDGCGRLEVTFERIDAVEASLKSLFKLTNGSEGLGGISLVGSMCGTLTGLLKSVLNTDKTIGEVLLDAIKSIVLPKDDIVAIVKQLGIRDMWKWAKLPSGLLGGQLNEWLNNKDLYETLSDPNATAEDQKRYLDTQREFRIRMVAVADSYLRRKLGESPSPLTLADERISAQSIADFIIIFLENVIGFSLETKCYPAIDFDWDGIEDIGFQFAALLAKQVRLIIRGTIGLTLRGAWEYSLHSDTLVEMIATIVGAAVSAFVEGCVRNIAFSFQIVSRYPGSPVGDTFIALEWKSLETIWDTGLDADQLEYVALFRGPCDEGAVIPDRIKGLVKDIGAYIDAAYRQVKVDSKFITQPVTDKVTITRAELQGDQLLVWATTSATFQFPQPVLRAYVCCDVLAMRPGETSSDPYTIDVRLARRPRCPEIFVLSNRGGVARRRLAIG